MPRFELDMNGQRFEIEAPDMQAAITAIGQQSAQSQQQPAAPDPDNALSVARRFATDSVLDTAILGVPDAVATGIANIPSPANIFQNPFSEDFENRTLFEDITGNEAPQLGERVLPVPRSEDVRAAADFTTGGAESFDAARAAERERRAELQAEFPISSGIGDAIGIGISLAMGRTPFVRKGAGSRQASKVQPKTPALFDPAQLGAKFESFPRRLQKSFNNALSSSIPKRIRRGIGRTAETALEGGTLAILQGGDPAETAAYAAGGQVGGSVLLTGLAEAGKTPTRIAVSALTTVALFRLGQEFSPGVNNVFDAVDLAYDKVSKAMVLGAFAGMVGAGRFRNKPTNIPEVTEGITAVLRGTAISPFISDIRAEQERGENRILPITMKLGEDPLFFTPDERRKMERALTGKASPAKTIDNLMAKPEFRNKVSGLIEQPVPATQS